LSIALAPLTLCEAGYEAAWAAGLAQKGKGSMSKLSTARFRSPSAVGGLASSNPSILVSTHNPGAARLSARQ